LWAHPGEEPVPAPFHQALQVDAETRALPMGRLVTTLGRRFLGTPYVAGTLDGHGEEHLVLTAEGLDCFTFVEVTLALAATVKQGGDDAAFRAALTRLRYRGGVLDGYASRLHYTSEWGADNAAKGLLRDVTAAVGGSVYDKTINFMGTHRDAYPALADDAVYARILAMEQSLQGRTLYQVPEAELTAAAAHIEEGDVLAITTTVPGLDVVHVGFAVFAQDGSLHLLHAGSVRGAVEVMPEPLVDYLTRSKSRQGVMVFRPIAPE